MNVYCEQDNSVTIVILEGDVSIPESERFREFLMKRIDSGARDLLLDFTSVSYVDSSGISALLMLLQAARKIGGDIRIAGISDRIYEVFRQIGLHHVFRKFESLEDGKKSYENLDPD